MRGKLRDKRTALNRDSFKREGIERRYPNRRDNRTIVWINPDEEQDENSLLDEQEEVQQEEIPVIEIPGVKILK